MNDKPLSYWLTEVINGRCKFNVSRVVCFGNSSDDDQINEKFRSLKLHYTSAGRSLDRQILQMAERPRTYYIYSFWICENDPDSFLALSKRLISSGVTKTQLCSVISDIRI
jgi:hypothetical protein